MVTFKVVVAAATLLLWPLPVFAGCEVPAAATAIDEQLPIGADATDQEKAAFALPYALMIGLATADAESPPGFQRGPGPAQLLPPDERFAAELAGLPVATFLACATDTVVVVFDGVSTFDPRQYLAALLRHADGGYSDLALAFVEAVVQAFPDRSVSVIGHSEGGNMASFAAGVLGLPSITFNASRTEASTFQNDGSKQMNVIVRGDPVGDPTGEVGLAGINLLLSVLTDRPHTMEAVLEGLLTAARGPA